MKEDERLQEIYDRVTRILSANRPETAGMNDPADKIKAILSKLDALEGELAGEKKAADKRRERIDGIIELLLRFTIMDFTGRAELSEERDEIDAIAAGLNALADEFQYLLDVQAQNDDKLEKKANELEAANRELEAFSYSISHDLRAPLRAILGYSQIMEEDYGPELNEEGRRQLTAIMVNAQKMGKLIGDLLEFSKSGRKELAKVKLDPGKIAQSAFAQLNETRQYEGEIIIHDMPQLEADRSLLTQVYVNLIGNAIKYSSKKEHPRIEIGVAVFEGERAFYVKDNGAGFNMKYYNGLFEVFHRLHREKDFDGTGVGLAIVKRIIQRHGGTIWARGRVNEGATFYFTIPTTAPEASIPDEKR